MKSFVLIIAMIFPLIWAEAATAPGGMRGPVRHGGSSLDEIPYIENRVLNTGSLRVNFANRGWFGNSGRGQDEALDDPCPPNSWAPQMEFPAFSGKEYLYQSGLWIGAEIVDSSLVRRRVSVGTDGWVNPAINEFWPGEGVANGIRHYSNIPGTTDCFGNSIYDPAARANDEFVITYSDTLTDPLWVEQDDLDGPHHPLQLKVQQTAMGWNSPAFSEFILLEYVLTNISPTPLQNVYLGLYVDGDIGPDNLTEQHTDDITGFLAEDTLTHDSVGIAWIADNDGWNPESPGGPLLVPHVMGMQVLAAPQQLLKWSYNWWVSSTSAARDYGPSWVDVVGDSGTPMGDARKYAILANGEWDLDQNYINNSAWLASHPQVYHDPCTGMTTVHPWRTPHSVQLDNIARGFDTRFLLSCGPLGIFDHMQGNECIYQLQPDAVCTLTVALMIGRDFHDPAHPQNPGSPTLNPALFHFTGLLQTSRAAEVMFRAHYLYQPPVPPQAFQPVLSAADAVMLTWLHPTVGTWQGYNLYKIDPAIPDISLPLNTTPVSGTTFTAGDLTLGTEWRFAIETIDDSGFVSARADTLVRVGAALPVSGLTATRFGALIRLFWNASDDPSVTGYRVVRRSAVPGDSTVVTAMGTIYNDQTAVPGRWYDYWVIADNNREVPSYPAGPVRILPWAPQRRILLIDETDLETSPSLFGPFPSGAVDSLYRRLLTNAGEEFDYFEQPANSLPAFTFEQIAQYDLLVWYTEDAQPNPPTLNRIQAREQILTDYVLAGGRLLRSGRQYGRNLGLPSGTVSGSSFEQQSATPLHFLSMQVAPRYNPAATVPTLKFTGATPALAGFPIVQIDTAKIAALRFSTQHVNFMPEVDLFWPQGYTQPLYRAVALPEDTTGWDNEPCGVIGLTEIVLGFPLYCLREEDAQALMNACVDMLRSLDTPPTPEPPAIPANTRLWQNYPNPFNPSTEIVFDLPRAARVEVAVFNIMGQRVATLVDDVRAAGTHRVSWDGHDLSSGIYFCRLQAGEFVETRKMMLLR